MDEYAFLLAQYPDEEEAKYAKKQPDATCTVKLTAFIASLFQRPPAIEGREMNQESDYCDEPNVVPGAFEAVQLLHHAKTAVESPATPKKKKAPIVRVGGDFETEVAEEDEHPSPTSVFAPNTTMPKMRQQLPASYDGTRRKNADFYINDGFQSYGILSTW